MDGAGGRQRPEPACMQQSEQCQAAAGRVVVWWWQRELRARLARLWLVENSSGSGLYGKSAFSGFGLFCTKTFGKMTSPSFLECIEDVNCPLCPCICLLLGDMSFMR